MITTEKFIELERKEWCVKTSRFELEELSVWHQLHFKSVREGGNGLFDDVLSERSLPLYEVTEEVMISQHCERGKCKLAGFSVHCDREVLYRQMRVVYNNMSHQILDVSTFFNAAKIWGSLTALQGQPMGSEGTMHSAMSDVLHSLEVLKFLTDQFFATATLSTTELSNFRSIVEAQRESSSFPISMNARPSTLTSFREASHSLSHSSSIPGNTGF